MRSDLRTDLPVDNSGTGLLIGLKYRGALLAAELAALLRGMAQPAQPPAAQLQTPPGSPLLARRASAPSAANIAAANAFSCTLCGLAIGMWTSHGARLRLLLRPASFVVLVDRSPLAEEAPPSRSLKLWSATVGRLPTSPFTLPRAAGSTPLAAPPATPAAAEESAGERAHPAAHAGVLAFEVQHCDVTGMAYTNLLLLPGRLVLEAAAVTRRAFASSSAAAEFYGGSACAALASPPPLALGTPARTPLRRDASGPAAACEQADTPGGTPLNHADAAHAPLPAAPRVLRSKTVVLHFEDAHLPAALKRAMLADSVRALLNSNQV